MSTFIRTEGLRAHIVFQAIAQNPDRVQSLEDIMTLPGISGWEPKFIASAIDFMVDTGSLREDAHGKVVLGTWRSTR